MRCLKNIPYLLSSLYIRCIIFYNITCDFVLCSEIEKNHTALIIRMKEDYERSDYVPMAIYYIKSRYSIITYTWLVITEWKYIIQSLSYEN